MVRGVKTQTLVSRTTDLRLPELRRWSGRNVPYLFQTLGVQDLDRISPVPFSLVRTDFVFDPVDLKAEVVRGYTSVLDGVHRQKTQVIETQSPQKRSNMLRILWKGLRIIFGTIKNIAETWAAGNTLFTLAGAISGAGGRTPSRKTDQLFKAAEDMMIEGFSLLENGEVDQAREVWRNAATLFLEVSTRLRNTAKTLLGNEAIERCRQQSIEAGKKSLRALELSLATDEERARVTFGREFDERANSRIFEVGLDGVNNRSELAGAITFDGKHREAARLYYWSAEGAYILGYPDLAANRLYKRGLVLRELAAIRQDISIYKDAAESFGLASILYDMAVNGRRRRGLSRRNWLSWRIANAGHRAETLMIIGMPQKALKVLERAFEKKITRTALTRLNNIKARAEKMISGDQAGEAGGGGLDMSEELVLKARDLVRRSDRLESTGDGLDAVKAGELLKEAIATYYEAGKQSKGTRLVTRLDRNLTRLRTPPLEMAVEYVESAERLLDLGVEIGAARYLKYAAKGFLKADMEIGAAVAEFMASKLFTRVGDSGIHAAKAMGNAAKSLWTATRADLGVRWGERDSMKEIVEQYEQVLVIAGEAARLYGQVDGREGSEARMYDIQSHVLERLGRIDEAIEVCQKALRVLEGKNSHQTSKFSRRLERLREEYTYE